MVRSGRDGEVAKAYEPLRAAAISLACEWAIDEASAGGPPRGVGNAVAGRAGRSETGACRVCSGGAGVWTASGARLMTKGRSSSSGAELDIGRATLAAT